MRFCLVCFCGHISVYIQCECVFMCAATRAADTVLRSPGGQAAAPTWSTGSHWTEPPDPAATRTSPTEPRKDPTASDWRCDAARLRQVQRGETGGEEHGNSPGVSSEQKLNVCLSKISAYWIEVQATRNLWTETLKERSQLRLPRCISPTIGQSQSFTWLFLYSPSHLSCWSTLWSTCQTARRAEESDRAARWCERCDL